MVSQLLGGLWRCVRAVFAASAGAGASRGLLKARAALPSSVKRSMERSNHRGETVSLVAGPVLAASATSAAVFGASSSAMATASAVAGVTAGTVGWYDDVVGARADHKKDKGFAGHVAALKEGRVSAGMVKVAGIGLAGLAAGWLLHRKPIDALLAGSVIAGTANLINLLDLRPGRAIKAGAVIGVPQLCGKGGGVVAGTLGASVALLPEDLSEKTMLGDCGANTLGALLGVGIAANTGRTGKLTALAALVALTAASEKVSFTKVIERTPVLRELDMAGRRPSEPAAELSGTQLSETQLAGTQSVNQ